MPRTLSPELRERLENTEETLGVSLAKLCIKAGLPALYVATMLDVTRMTLHTWFRGGNIREDRKIKIEKFMQLIEDDIQAGVLPKKNLNETKRYAEAFSGKPILSSNRKTGITALKVVG